MAMLYLMYSTIDLSLEITSLFFCFPWCLKYQFFIISLVSIVIRTTKYKRNVFFRIHQIQHGHRLKFACLDRRINLHIDLPFFIQHWLFTNKLDLLLMTKLVLFKLVISQTEYRFIFLSILINSALKENELTWSNLRVELFVNNQCWIKKGKSMCKFIRLSRQANLSLWPCCIW
jgi:hypothetical protein